MKSFLIILIVLFLNQTANGQDTIAAKDTQALREFWAHFTDALQSKSRKSLSQLLSLPVNLKDYKLDTARFDTSIQFITKENIWLLIDTIFFDKRLMHYVISTRKSKEVFVPMAESGEYISNRESIYTFGYKLKSEIPYNEVRFTAKKFIGKYKIVSAWTLCYVKPKLHPM